MSRSEIKNAPYNPRKISEHARKKLKAKLKRSGLVMPLVWNRQTGNLVGGHQRISILDELEKSQDYKLTVAAIDVDLMQEKELNVFLNNDSAMGEWDSEALEEIVKDLGTIEGTGFDLIELQAICDGIESSVFAGENDKAKSTIEDIQGIKDRRKEALAKNKGKDDVEFYVVVVFQSSLEVDQFLEHCLLPVDQRYVDGRRMANLVGCEIGENPNHATEGLSK